jgi:hypothetical protein
MSIPVMYPFTKQKVLNIQTMYHGACSRVIQATGLSFLKSTFTLHWLAYCAFLCVEKLTRFLVHSNFCYQYIDVLLRVE